MSKKEVSAKISTPAGDAAKLEATVGTDLTQDVVVEIANDTFVTTAVKENAEVSSWFKLSDATKASIKSATVKSGATEATATVTLVIEPKVATATDTPVTVIAKIPEQSDATKAFTKGNKDIEITNDITITVKEPKVVSVSSDKQSVAIKYIKGSGSDTTPIDIIYTLIGATVKNEVASTQFDGSAIHSRLNPKISKVADNQFKLTLTPTTDVYQIASSSGYDNKDCKFTISKDNLVVKEGYKSLEADLECTINIKAEKAAQ